MTGTSGQSAAPMDYARDLLDAARDNPVPTALIGMGLAWMLLGRSTSSPLRTLRDLGGAAVGGLGAGSRRVAEGASALASGASDAASAGLGAAADHAAGLGLAVKRQIDERSPSATMIPGVKAAVDDRLDAVTEAAGGIASQARAGVSGMSSQAGDAAGDLVATLREGFADLLERRPLVLGALGVAVGAGVAAALPRIAAEGAFTDGLGDLKASVSDGFTDAYARAANEARAQGLTPDAAAGAASDLGGKVKDVAKGAIEDVKSSVG